MKRAVNFGYILRSAISRRHRALTEIQQVNRDLEERTAELQSANRELEAFGYSLSHDLRSFLTKISVAAQLLEADADSALSETGSNCLATILTAIDGMDDLIQAMLVISQFSRKALRIETVDLSELVGLRLGEPQRLVALGDRQLLRVVQRHGGTIWAEGSAGGAVFYFTLP